jgi:hypothetical protein
MSSPPPVFREIQIPSPVLYLRNLILLLTPCEGGGTTWLPGEMNLYLIVYELVHQQVISPLICFIVVESDNWRLLWCYFRGLLNLLLFYTIPSFRTGDDCNRTWRSFLLWHTIPLQFLYIARANI